MEESLASGCLQEVEGGLIKRGAETQSEHAPSKYEGGGKLHHTLVMTTTTFETTAVPSSPCHAPSKYEGGSKLHHTLVMTI